MPKRGGKMKMNVENVVIAVLVLILLGLVAYYVHLKMKKQENYKSNVVVIFYHAKWCPHCTSMMPEWEKFKTETEHTTKEYESESIPEAHKSRVDGFPTICAEVDGEVKYHNGERTASALHDWVASL